MRFRTAIALIALATPAVAQHGGRGGSFGVRGAAHHAGHSSASGFSGARGLSAPGPNHFGAPVGTGFRGTVRPSFAGLRNPASANRFIAGRGPGRSAGAGRRGDRDRERFNQRRRDFDNWYSSSYPLWPGYGYPYVIDPGFYDWGDTDSGDPRQASAYDQGSAAPVDRISYPDQAFSAPGPRPSAPVRAAVRALQPRQAITILFKDGRAPVRMQNYMMTANTLTDLDAQQYERIPLDQVDVVATQWANNAAGMDFRVPAAARD